MRDHDLSPDAELRPKGSRIDGDGGRPEPALHTAAEAAAHGRADVLGPDDVLGLQRAAGNAGVGAALQGAQEEDRSPVLDVVGSGSGRPLEPEVRADMEGRFGQDFSDVRVHDGAAAHESATAVNAHAYTVGHDVVFQRDHYDPGSEQGRLTLAHELTHVVQQRSGPVDGTEAPGGIRVSDPGDRFEQEASDNAARVLSDPAPAAQGAGPDLGAAAGPAVQRQGEEEAPEEPEVQGLFAGTPAVQREEEEEEPA